MSTIQRLLNGETELATTFKVERANGDPTEYHKVVGGQLKMVNGVPTLVDGEDVKITEKEYKERTNA